MAAAQNEEDDSLSELSHTPSHAGTFPPVLRFHSHFSGSPCVSESSDSSEASSSSSSDEEPGRHAVKASRNMTVKMKKWKKPNSRAPRRAEDFYGKKAPIYKPRKRQTTGPPSQGIDSLQRRNCMVYATMMLFNVTC
jgi:hypothetical protein